VYELEISNNVILRAGGTPCVDGTAQTGPSFVGGTRPTPITSVAHGISVGGNSVDPNATKIRPKIFNNTVVDSDERGINVGSGAATGGFVQNNIVLNSRMGAFLISGSTGITPTNNVTTGTLTNIFQNYVANFNLNGLPTPNADDLRLKAAQIPATGTRGTNYTATDINGVTRGTGSSGTAAPDVGAYEYA
jgi:hypothetical protein